MPIAEARAEIRAAATALTPADRPGDYAQAMMDLGATICRPKQPDCPACPLAEDCRAFASGEPERFPAPKAKRDAPAPPRHRLLGRARRAPCGWCGAPRKGLLGGDGGACPGPSGARRRPARQAIATVRHGFTHFTLDLHLVAAPAPPPGEGWWQPLATLSEAGLPTLYRRAAEAGLAMRETADG